MTAQMSRAEAIAALTAPGQPSPQPTAYAVPDDRMGEEVGATIYASEGLDLDQLREFATQHLARFELPRYILRSSGPLPRMPSGKIFNRQIRDEAVAKLAADPAALHAGARR